MDNDEVTRYVDILFCPCMCFLLKFNLSDFQLHVQIC